MVDPFRADSRDPQRWWGFGALAPLALAIGLGLVLVAAVTGYEVAAHRSPTYIASAATLLDQPLPIAQSQDAGVVDKLARLRLKYAGVLRSDAVVDDAAKRAGVSHDVMAASLAPRVDDASLLLYVGAVDARSKRAITMANALAVSLQDYVRQEQVAAQIAPRDRVDLRVVAPARHAVAVLPTTRQRLLSGFGAGIVAFVLVAGVLDIMRRRAV